MNSGTGSAVKLGSTIWMPVVPVRLERWNSSTQNCQMAMACSTVLLPLLLRPTSRSKRVNS
jgi:hypothetical protein